MDMTAETHANEVELSLVIPAYNEQETIVALLSRIAEVFEGVDYCFEAVIVDDGSTDKTLQLLKVAKREKPWLRVITLDRNHGQTAAMSAGFRVAAGRVIATLDADLQNDPAEVPRLMAMLTDCDAVVGWRQKRQDPWIRKVSTRIANAVRNWLSDETIHDSACSLKVYKRHCIERMMLFEGMHRFMPTLVKMQGYKVAEVPISHHPRYAGQAKYGVWNRVFKAFFDLLAVRWMKKRSLRYKFNEIE
jgi:glycosyltransferase involved in cell wall biosynthesis